MALNLNQEIIMCRKSKIERYGAAGPQSRRWGRPTGLSLALGLRLLYGVDLGDANRTNSIGTGSGGLLFRLRLILMQMLMAADGREILNEQFCRSKTSRPGLGDSEPASPLEN